jgi:KRAB domain-containing zinc finger protein
LKAQLCLVFYCNPYKVMQKTDEIINELYKHSIAHTHRLFYCHFCKMKFYLLRTLKRHLYFVHLNNKAVKSFVKSCRLSDIEKEAQIMEIEKNSDFDGDSLNDDNGLEIQNNPEQKREERLFKCSFSGCQTSFRHRTSFIMHEKCVHSTQRNFFCHLCSKSFKTTSVLNVHIKMHTNLRDHSCLHCTKSFFTSSHLKAHLKIHMKILKFECELPGCKKRFIHLSSFKKHQNFHLGIRSFICHICKKKFSQLCHLREHIKTHSEERLYTCQQCNKAFRRRDTLRIHQKSQSHLTLIDDDDQGEKLQKIN